MADVVLGCAFRTNFGLMPKYDPNLNSIYKGYIDTLERDMIGASYNGNVDSGTITKVLNLDISQEDIDSCIGDVRYAVLESAIIRFCKKHDVELSIQRNSLDITITVKMLNNFQVLYI